MSFLGSQGRKYFTYNFYHYRNFRVLSKIYDLSSHREEYTLLAISLFLKEAKIEILQTIPYDTIPTA